MTLRLAGVLAASMLAGCFHISQGTHVTSQAKFERANHQAVWGRALTSFQNLGALVQTIDPNSRLLRSDVQSGWVRCSNASADKLLPNSTCEAHQVLQLTLTDDGDAFLRINRGITGKNANGKSLLTPEDKQVLQSQCDSMLDFIVGKSKTPPALLGDPPVGAPWL